MLAQGVAEILDVGYGADDSVHVLYSKLSTGQRPWGEQERNLWHAFNPNDGWTHELLGEVDGTASLALDEQERAHVMFVRGRPVHRAGFITAEFWVMYGARTAP